MLEKTPTGNLPKAGGWGYPCGWSGRRCCLAAKTSSIVSVSSVGLDDWEWDRALLSCDWRRWVGELLQVCRRRKAPPGEDGKGEGEDS